MNLGITIGIHREENKTRGKVDGEYILMQEEKIYENAEKEYKEKIRYVD